MKLQNWHPTKLVTFCCLSAVDLIFTYRLICLSGGQIYESNPIAHAWLAAYGWMGLAFFKIGMVLIVLASALIIGRSRPKTAGRVLVFACFAVAFVVSYSYKLGGSEDLLANCIRKEPANLLMDGPSQRAQSLEAMDLVAFSR